MVQDNIYLCITHVLYHLMAKYFVPIDNISGLTSAIILLHDYFRLEALLWDSVKRD